MKTEISLPAPIFEEAESLSKRLGVSRSELYTNALKAYLQRYNRYSFGSLRSNRTLEKLNEIYTEQPSGADPVLSQMQFMSLLKRRDAANHPK